jgi:hypothetical protein
MRLLGIAMLKDRHPRDNVDITSKVSNNHTFYEFIAKVNDGRCLRFFLILGYASTPIIFFDNF